MQKPNAHACLRRCSTLKGLKHWQLSKTPEDPLGVSLVVELLSLRNLRSKMPRAQTSLLRAKYQYKQCTKHALLEMNAPYDRFEVRPALAGAAGSPFFFCPTALHEVYMQACLGSPEVCIGPGSPATVGCPPIWSAFPFPFPAPRLTCEVSTVQGQGFGGVSGRVARQPLTTP